MKSLSPTVVTIASICLNFILSLLKFWAGLVSSSTALIADAWHTLSDSISSLAVLGGIKFSLKPADKNHPLGHGRAELIAALVVGILMAILGFNFLKESVLNFKSRDTFDYGSVAIWITIISIVVKELMARYSIYYGNQSRYSSLVADGLNHRSDAVCSFILLLGMILGGGYWWIDSLLGTMVSILIFVTTYKILRRSMSQLIGEGIDPGLREEIILCGSDVGGNYSLQPHHFKMHHYGNHSELTFHVRLPGKLSLERAHEIASNYEKAVQEKFNINVTIHVDATSEPG